MEKRSTTKGVKSYIDTIFLSKETLFKGLDELVSWIEVVGDYVIPIARRGIRTLQLSSYSKKLFENDRIIYFEALKLHAHEDDLKNRTIILFDESIGSGRTIMSIKENIKRFSANHKLNLKIKTSSLLIRNISKYRPDYYLQDFLLTYDEYNYFSRKISEEIFLLGKPLDIDHLIFNISLFNQDISRFRSFIKENYKSTRRLWHSRYYKALNMFTIDLKHDFKIPRIEEPALFLDEGPKKIRIFIRGNFITLVPIVYPAMEINERILNSIKVCPFLEILNEASPCKILNNEYRQNMDKAQSSFICSSICYNCIVNNLNAYLITDFLRNLKKFISFEFIGLDDQCIQTISHSEKRDIIQRYRKKVSIAIDKDIPYLNFQGEAPRCELPIISHNDDKVILKNVRPETRLSTAIELEKRKNNQKFFYTGKSSNRSSFGLSYFQMEKLLKGLNEQDFSEAMDICLDEGYLKPFYSNKGIEISYNKKKTLCIVRLYTSAGENASEIIMSYFNLIKKHRDKSDNILSFYLNSKKE